MSETKVNFSNTTDLLFLGDGVKDVPLKDIARVLLNEISHQESDICLYDCLFTNIIHHFEPEEFEAEVSCIILPKLVVYLEKIQNELQTNALPFFNAENLSILLRLAEVLTKLAEYLTIQAERCRLYRSVIIFPEYLLRCYTIVRQNYVAMSKDPEVMDSMKALYTVCKKILMIFLELLYPRNAIGRSSYFHTIESDMEYECLEKVCKILASVGNEISPIDSLLASDVWKAIVKLSSEHAEKSFGKNRTGWLNHIILSLNTGIDSSFNEIRLKNEPSKQAIVALKLNAFLLRVLQKLLSLSKQHLQYTIFEPIIETILDIITCRRSKQLCTELAEAVEQYLHVGYMAIIENMFPSKAFAKEFCQHECKTSEKIYSFYVLLMHIVRQIVCNANKTELLATYCQQQQNLLAHICTLLKRSDRLLLQNDALYKQLLTHSAVLILLSVRLKTHDTQKTMEETLVGMVLQEHYYTALLGIDLWSVFGRYHSTQLLYYHFIFWKKINDRFSHIHARPEQVFVAQLLKNLWVFLPMTLKLKILDKYSVSDGLNDRLWATVAIPGESEDLLKSEFSETVEMRLQSKINLLQKRPVVSDFYEMLGLLIILPNVKRGGGASQGIVHPLLNLSINWKAIWNTSAAASILYCLEKSPENIPDSVLSSFSISSFSRTRTTVKHLLVKLIGNMSISLNVAPIFVSLIKGDCSVITAVAFNLLEKMELKGHFSANQLVTKRPEIKSQLSFLKNGVRIKQPYFLSEGKRVSVKHHCQSTHTSGSDPHGDMKIIINNQTDELLSVDVSSCCGNDVGRSDSANKHLIESDSFTGLKKRKVDNDSESSMPIDHCINQLDTQGRLLQTVLQSQQLKYAHKQQLKNIIATLTKALES